jgi:hypothetical protein
LKDLALQFATAKGNGLRQYQKEVSFHFPIMKGKRLSDAKGPTATWYSTHAGM